MSDAAFADASRPAPVTILRVPLLDYSVGHELLLLRTRNALLSSEADFNELPAQGQRKAIIRAVLICSRSWEKNKQADKWLWIWGRSIRRENFELAIADFRIYRNAGSSFPAILPNKEDADARRLGAPYLARLIAYGATVFGSTVFDSPFGMMQWLYFSHAESEGSCRIENEIEEQERIQEAQHLADIKREREAKEGTCPL